MTGTVAGAMEARGISAAPENLKAEAEGVIEEIDGKMLLTQIRVRYRLKVPKEKRAGMERALAHHDAACAASESIRRGIGIEWLAEIEEDNGEAL